MKYPIKHSLLCLAVVNVSAHAPTVYAETNKSQADKSFEEVVVTANRSEQKISNVPVQVEVVDETKLDNTSAYFITDTLKKNASVDVIQYPGGLSGVGIRGIRPSFLGINQRVLILIDGRPAGATSLGNLTTAGIERIEVLKGSASAIYGPSAMGGVINYITRKSKGDIAGDVRLGYGSFDTYKFGYNVGGSLNDAWDFDLGVSYYTQRDDYDMGKGGQTFANFQQGNGAERPNTEFENKNLFARAAYTFAPGWQAQLRIMAYDSPIAETPGAESRVISNQGEADNRTISGDISINGEYGRHQTKLVVYQVKEEANSINKPNSAPKYLSFSKETVFSGIQLNDSFSVTDNTTLVYGIEYSFAEAKTGSFNADGSKRAPWSPNSDEKRYGVFLDVTNNSFNNRVVFNIGARYDRIKSRVLQTPLLTSYKPGSESFSTINPRMGLVLRPHSDSPYRLHSSIGTGYIVPKAIELAGESNSFGTTIRGNPDLKPESSTSFDLGIAYSSDVFGVDLTYFRIDVDDRITRVDLNPAGTQKTYENALSSLTAGWEFSSYWDLGSLFNTGLGVWRGDFTSTYFTKRNERLSSGPSSIKNVARFKVNIGFGYDNGIYDARLSARHVRGMNDNDFSSGRVFTNGNGGTYEYPAFTVADLSMGWNLQTAHRVTLKVDNLTDKYYVEKGDFPMSGRAFHAGYRYSF